MLGTLALSQGKKPAPRAGSFPLLLKGRRMSARVVLLLTGETAPNANLRDVYSTHDISFTEPCCFM